MDNGALFDYQQLYHTGIRVPNLAEAMIEIGQAMGVTWAAPVDNPGQAVWTPEAGLHSVPLKFTYSCEGPQHIELLQAPPRSLWSGHEEPGVHHQGVWVDDVAASVTRATDLGWECVAAGADPSEGYGSFAYVQPPSGMIVEFVTAAIKPRFEAWWAGGSL